MKARFRIEKTLWDGLKTRAQQRHTTQTKILDEAVRLYFTIPVYDRPVDSMKRSQFGRADDKQSASAVIDERLWNHFKREAKRRNVTQIRLLEEIVARYLKAYRPPSFM